MPSQQAAPRRRVRRSRAAAPAAKAGKKPTSRGLGPVKAAVSRPISSVAAASAYSKGMRTGEPRILQRTARSTRIAHREFVGNVVGSSTFTVANTYAINPGMSGTFPWLSVQAAGWEMYKFHKLKFCYYTRTGTATAGSVLLVPDYDASDPAPTTEMQASSYRDVIEEVPWIEEFSCALDAQAMMEPGNRKYVRTGPLGANLDIKTYDGGNLFVCTTDGSAVSWGKLWVEYEVEFFVPQTLAAAVLSGVVTGAGSVSKTSVFGTSATVSNNLPVTATGMVITFLKVGTYQVVTSATGTTVNLGTPTGTGVSGIQTSTSGTTTVIRIDMISVTNPGQTFTVVDGGSGTITACSAYISTS